MKKIRYSGFRSATNQYIRVASRNIPIYIGCTACAACLQDFCSGNKNISYTAVLVKIIASAVREYPIMNAILSRGLIRKHIYIPDEVDISISMEKVHNGETVVAIPVIRAANQKSIETIAAEIKLLSELPYDEFPFMKHVMFFFRLPDFLQYFILKLACQSPHTFKLLFGTIGLTTLGKIGIPVLQPAWINSITFGIGSIENKPVVIDNKIEIAPVLQLNMCFHHGVMDGGMAGRILSEVKSRIEAGNYTSL
jgi:pyruvate/2-oxoglutarate dehydrogenase complex dihydrolipoamide acyltransferase (E2) component